MNWSATIASSFWLASSLGDWRRFKRSLDRPEETQLGLLKSLLASNRDCEFGLHHGFSSISTYREFVKRVPLSDYESVQPWIDRLRAGESNLLTSDRVSRLVPTSGTTTARKLIPFTNGLQREFNRAIAPWIVDLVRHRPRILSGPAYWSISPTFQRSLENSKVPIGFDDDVNYLGGAKAWLVRKSVITPDVHGKDILDFQSETIRTLAACRDLRLISVWHPSFLTLLLDLLPAGTSPRDIWPNLQVISCWADAAAEGPARELGELFPGVLVQKKGLLATEAFITIPFQDAHPLALRSHFFEFIDSAGEIRLAQELRLDQKYEVVVSTSGGLWRYRLRDVLQVTGFLGKTPSLRFLGRANTSDLRGEKLTEEFVASCVTHVFERLRFALLAPSSDGTHYNLFLEGAATSEALDRFENALRNNPHYAHCRDLGQLQPIALIPVTAGASATFLRVQATNDVRFGDIKPTYLSLKTDWERTFNASAGAAVNTKI